MRGRSDSSLLRLINSRKIVDVVLAVAPQGISRAEVARATGLSKPTVSALVGDLEAAGLMRMTDPGQPQWRHRPAGGALRDRARCEPRGGRRHRCHQDHRGGRRPAGAARRRGADRHPRPTPPPRPTFVVEAAFGLLDGRDRGRDRLRNACIGGAGACTAPAPTASRWRSTSPDSTVFGSAAISASALPSRCRSTNDVNLAAVAEADAGAGHADFAAVSIGTGIGTGLIISGELYRGGTRRGRGVGAR